MIFVPYPIQENFFLSIEISQNTGVSDFEYDLLGFRNDDSHDVFNGIPTSSQKYYFQALGNSQRLERVLFFFECANARIGG